MSRAPILELGDCLLIGHRAIEGCGCLPGLATDKPLASHRLVIADFADPHFPKALHAILGCLGDPGCPPLFLMMGAISPSPSAVAHARIWRKLLQSSGLVVVEIDTGALSTPDELRSLVKAWLTVLRTSGLGHLNGLMTYLKGSPSLRCVVATTAPYPGLHQETYDRLAAEAFGKLRRAGPCIVRRIAGVITSDWEVAEVSHLENLLESLSKSCGQHAECGPVWFTDSGMPAITLLLLG